LNKFFYGSTAPFGDSSRQPDQFRFRAQWRTITRSGLLLLFSAGYTASLRPASPIFISGGGRSPGHPISLDNRLDTCGSKIGFEPKKARNERQ
jgi:hypothetical protein